MIILLGLALVVLALWVSHTAAERRRAEARLRVVAAYAAGLADAPPREPSPTARAQPSPELAYAGNRVQPTAESRRLGYWGHPPCEIVAEDEVPRRLGAQSGRPLV